MESISDDEIERGMRQPRRRPTGPPSLPPIRARRRCRTTRYTEREVLARTAFLLVSSFEGKLLLLVENASATGVVIRG